LLNFIARLILYGSGVFEFLAEFLENLAEFFDFLL
jgi:hypothetical protein